MIRKIYTTKQKQNAGLNMFLDTKGFISVAFIWILMVIALMFIFIGCINYLMYSYQSMIIGRAVDYAVSAAVQEIDVERSAEGISEGFDERTGLLNSSEILINEQAAKKVFFMIFTDNTGISEEEIADKLTMVSTYPHGDEIKYTIVRGLMRTEGVVQKPADLESKINEALIYGDVDRDYNIFVNGNPKTNEFSKRPYYMAVLKDYEVQGIISRRKITCMGFRAGRINRRGDI